MSAMWEIQKSIYDTLYANTTFMNLISNQLYDEPPTDCNYPYVVLGQSTEIPANRLSRNGYENTLTLYIHTKPAGLGFYTAKKILEAMNSVLNMKKLSLTSYTMVICSLDNVLTEKYEDKRIIHVRYRIIAHSDTNISF